MGIIGSSLKLTAGNLAVRFGSYLYRILMARMLTPQEYGILSLALPLQFLVVVLGSAGIAPSVAKFVAEHRAKGELGRSAAVAGAGLVYYTLAGAALALAFVVLSPIVAGAYGIESLSPVLQLSAAALPFGFALAVLTGVLQGTGRFGAMAALLTSLQFLRILLAAGAVAVSATAASAVLGSTLGFAGVLALALPLTLRELGRGGMREFRRLFYFSLPVSVSSALGFLLAFLDIILLGFYAPPGEVGIYGAASPAARVALAFAMALSAVLLPRVSALSASGRRGELTRTLAGSFRATVMVLGGVSLITGIFAKELVVLLFGSTYAEAAEPLRVLVAGSFFYGLFSVSTGALQGLGKPEAPARILTLAVLLEVALCLLLIPEYGMMGAASASAASSAAAGVLAMVTLYREVGRRKPGA